jgi:small ligand-binding sensory domain FIST
MIAKKIFSSYLSKNQNWREALSEIASHVKKDMKGETCDFLIAYVSEAYENLDPAAFVNKLANLVPHRVLIGCNSSGVIGDAHEIEMEPAISVLAMHVPGLRIHSFVMSEADLSSLSHGADLINFLDVYPPDKPHFICLADPASVDVVKFLQIFNEGYKGLPVTGGMASGTVMGKPNWLCLNGNIYSEGMVGVALVGNIEFDVIVSQGSRPVGTPFVITRTEGNVLYELAGRPALDVVRDLVGGLSPKDKKLAEYSLSVGIVMNEQQTSFKRGDFLIRNIVGFDPDVKALMIGAVLKVGQTLQFQVRDAETSAEDLSHMLEKIRISPKNEPRAGMLVSCCGRGRDFYGKPDHDIKAIQLAQGPIPITGFFANGELGPVGFKNFVHGYTSSLVIFR